MKSLTFRYSITQFTYWATIRRHALLLATFLLSAPLFALTEGNFTYEVSNDKATITSFSDSFSGNLSIPSTLGGHRVTKIGEGAFFECSALTSVEIPASVTKIDWGAFYGCSSLTSVEIPASVTSIGSMAFSGCSSLTSVVIPKGVTKIGEGVFLFCSDLLKIHRQ